MQQVKGLLALAAIAATALPCSAQVFALDFEGAADLAQLLGFYGGGTDSAGNSGTDFGITFSSDAVAAIDEDAGGSGNIANEPSASTVLVFEGVSGPAVLNYEAGFTDAVSFFYSSSFDAPVMVYDGLNATGNLLGTINLSRQFNDNCSGDPNGSFCNWTAAGVSFSGVAKSLGFNVGPAAYDNITFGSANPIPEPQTYALMALGLAAIGWATRRRRKV